jgi:hypothetical protein
MIAMSALLAQGVAVTTDEMAGARKWVAARFEAAEPAKKAEPGLLVLANNDPLVKNNESVASLQSQVHIEHALTW